MTGLELVGLALAAGSSVMGGIQANAMAQQRASVDDRNARLSRQNADRAIQRSQVEAQDQDFENAALEGEQIAFQGASGLGGRSQQLLRKSTQILGRLGSERIIQGGQLESAANLQEAENFDSAAAMARAEGNNALISGVLGAATSLVGGATSTRTNIFRNRTPRIGPLPRTRTTVGLRA